MDQSRDGLTILGESVQYGLKQMLPECFVSVKLETYEDGSCSDSQQFGGSNNSVVNPTNNPSTTAAEEQPQAVFVGTRATQPLRRPCCNQAAVACNCITTKDCLVPTSTSPVADSTSSPQIVYQYHTATSIMQQAPPPPPTTQTPQTQQQSSEAGSAVGRIGPPTHSFSHTHHPHRTATEISWLPQSYVTDPTVSAQNSQHFHPHQMSYISHDGTLLTQAHGESIRIMKPTSSSASIRPDNSVTSTPILGISGLSGLPSGDVGDPNAFLSHVLNHQRGGMTTGTILMLDPGRSLTTHHLQQPNGERHDDVQSHSIKVDQNDSGRPVEDSSRNSTPAGHENSDTSSTTESPKPGEGHLVSRYCQTVVTMSQLQDTVILPDAKILIESPDPEDNKEKVFETSGKELTIIETHSEETFNCKKTQKRVNPSSTHFSGRSNFGNQRHTLNCEEQLNSANQCLNGDSKCQETVAQRGEATQMKNEGSPNSKSSSNGSNFTYLDIDRMFRCDICGKTYPTHQALINHERYHRGERPYECEICHKAFATNSHLVTHRRTHTGERPFQCQQCHRCFADRSAFVKHERTHGPNGVIIKRYKCEECGNGFVDSCGLKKHTRIHTGERPYVCTVCEKSFSTSSTFVAHKRIHTGERPYKCESCDKMFITKSHLLTHRRTHTGEKPFTCSVCSRCFADGSSFRRHERLHSGENRHVCEMCGKGFPLEASLEKHKQTHVQLNNYSYMYENRSDLNCVASQQQQQNCDLQPNRSSVIPVVQVQGREAQPDRNTCVDLSREMAGEVAVSRNGMCGVASRDLECDNQTARSSIMVPAREIA